MPSIYINESDVSGLDQIFVSNMYSGKILGEIMRLQDKNIIITQNGTQTVTFDTGYTGLRNVNISTNVVPDTQTKSVTITENGSTTIIPDENKYLSSVGVTVNVPSIQLAKTVTFKTPNGTSPETYSDFQIVSTINGVAIANPTKPTAPQDKFFLGWKEEGESVHISFPYSPNEDKTLIADFNEIEYIQADGNQYIDPNVTITNQSYFEVKFQYNETPNNDTWIFGRWVSFKDTMIGYYGGTIRCLVGASDTVFQQLDNNVHIVQANSTEILYDDIPISTPNWNNVPSDKYYIFWDGYANHNKSKGRIYYVKIWNGDTLVRDFIPAVSHEAGHYNEICLFDLVSQTYFYNQGRGSFTTAE